MHLWIYIHITVRASQLKGLDMNPFSLQSSRIESRAAEPIGTIFYTHFLWVSWHKIIWKMLLDGNNLEGFLVVWCFFFYEVIRIYFQKHSKLNQQGYKLNQSEILGSIHCVIRSPPKFCLRSIYNCIISVYNMMGAKLKKAGYKVVNDYKYNFKTQR